MNLGGSQRRTLLAVLVVHAGDAVSTDRLVEELWGDAPPPAARKTVQAHVAHLRAAVNVERETLGSFGDGYVLRLDPDVVDVRRFEEMVAEAGQMRSEDPLKAVRRFEEALDLFRGAPLTGLADNAFSLRVEAERLAEMRLGAIEDRLDALLAAGETQSVAAQAERLVAEHPLRERLWSIHMLGLYRAGRQAEALRAYSRLRQTLAEELGIEPSHALQELEQRILTQDPDLTEVVAAAVSALPSDKRVVRNPYKGLRTFDEADASDFFGRSDLVRRLEERIESRTSSRLLFLAGPSGAGKSSVVRAGLMPRLRDRHRVGIMFPGDDPVTALAKALSEATDQTPEEALAALESGELGTDETVIVVDQFEELFTLASEEATSRFLELLTNPQSMRWVATVRADFLDRLMVQPRLGPVLEDALVLIPPLQDHEIRAAVTGPAEGVGVDVEPELIAAVVGDVRARPSALPLLQYALTDTFERRRSSEMTLADYQRSGGISGALARRAEELYSSLSTAQQAAARHLFLRLVTVTDDGELAKRRVGKDPLVDGEVETSTIVERFGAQRLLTFDQDPESGRPTVEVAHEALMSEWPRLASWIEAARGDLRMARRLAAAAAEWEDSERDPSFLLTGARLAEMESWRKGSEIDPPETERHFLGLSRQAEDAEAAGRSRRKRLSAAVITAAAVVALVLASVALSQREAAAEQARIVRASDLASAAVAALGIDPDLSILLAIEAVETTRRVDGSVLDVAEEALHRAVLADTLLRSVPNGANGLAHFSPDGSTFLAAGQDPTTVQVWSVDPVEPVQTLTGHEAPVLDAVYDPNGDRIASTSSDGTVRIWDVASGELEKTFVVEGPAPLIPVFSWDGTMLAASSDEPSGTVFVWDVETEELLWELPAPSGTSLTLNLDFSPDGTLLAVAPEMEGGEDAIHVWDLTSGALLEELVGHGSLVKDVGFSPDGKKLVSGSWDTTLRIWSTETWETEQIFFGHESSVWDLQVSSDGAIVASSGNNEAVVWDLQTGETLTRIVAHDGIVDGVDLNSSNDRLLTGSLVDMTTRVWDITSTARHELLALPGSTGLFGTVAFSPDGGILAASSMGGSATLWEFPSGRELGSYQVLEGDPAVDSLSFHPDGDLLAFADREGAGVIDIAAGEVIPVLQWADGGVVSYSEGGALSAAGDGAYVWADPLGMDVRLRTEGPTFTLALDPSGETALLSLFDRIEVRNIETAEIVTTLTENADLVRRIAFTPDGDKFVTASLNSHVDIWSGSDFEHLLRVEPHTGQVMAVDVHPNGRELATVGDDETVRIIDMETGTVRLTLPGMPFAAVDYSPNGRYLAATGPEGVVMVYMLELDDLLSEARTRLTRWWTETECLQYLGAPTCPDAPAGLGASE